MTVPYALEKETLLNIHGYMDFLRNEYGLLTTYHLVQYGSSSASLANDISLDPGLLYHEHTHPLCSYFKRKLSFWNHCQERQHKIVDRVQNGSFCGMCWAGMTEFIYPVRNEFGKIHAFVCVSGYCVDREKAVPRIRRVCREYRFSFEHAMEIFDNAEYKSLPDKQRLDLLINPLCNMLTLLLMWQARDEAETKSVETNIGIGTYTSIRQYLETVYASNVTINDLCKRYNCSASYISRLLRKFGNTSFRQIVNTLRIDLACSMLEKQEYSIQYIAAAAGFSDANYFSTVFSKYKGMSPREYRRGFSPSN